MSDEADYPQGKDELLDRIAREWDELQAAVARVPPDRLEMPDAGGWSAKDNLAHLADWEGYLRLHHMRGQPSHEVMGVDAAAFEALDEDGQNAILFERHRDQPVPEVVAALQASHEQLLQDLMDMPFTEMTAPRYPGDPDARPLLWWIAGNTYEHYREHRAVIERLAGS